MIIRTAKGMSSFDREDADPEIHVRKLFKEEMGKSVAEYMAELRFHKAQELLLITDHPAKKIGELVGSTT